MDDVGDVVVGGDSTSVLNTNLHGMRLLENMVVLSTFMPIDRTAGSIMRGREVPKLTKSTEDEEELAPATAADSGNVDDLDVSLSRERSLRTFFSRSVFSRLVALTTSFNAFKNFS
jgi:hypothetical protein